MSGDTQTLSEFEAHQRAGRESSEDAPDSFDFDFAQLVPVNDSARLAFDELAKLKAADPEWNPHARNYIHVEEEQEPFGDDDDDEQSDEPSSPSRSIHTGYFRLSLGLQPKRFARGWVIGCGRQALSDPDVDFLVTVDGRRDRVRSRHAQIVYHRETRVLMLKVPPKKSVILDGVKLQHGAAALTRRTSGLTIGNLSFQLQFHGQHRAEYLAQLDKIAELSTYFVGDRIETLDPTPSDQYFTLHGYQFQTPQAAGAYGVVSACVQNTTGDVYAVKRVKKSRDTTEEVEKELQIFRALNTHTHICSLVEHFTLGTGRIQELYMILSPYAPQTLSDWLKSPQDRSQLLRAFHQGAQGLRHIHSCGVIHRDIKPENILVANGFRIIIADFGHSTTDEQSQNHYKGTLRYLPPEIYELKEEISYSGHWSTKSDVFSYGVVGFEMLHRPFRRPRNGMITRPTQLALLQELNNQSSPVHNLLVKMLAWDCRRRATIRDVLLAPVWPGDESPSQSKKRTHIDAS